jgi:hypothetical protein
LGRYLGAHREKVGQLEVVEALISAAERDSERDGLVAIVRHLEVSSADSARDVRRSRAIVFDSGGSASASAPTTMAKTNMIDVTKGRASRARLI